MIVTQLIPNADVCLFAWY